MSDDDAYNDYEDFEGDGFDEEMDSSLLNSSLRGSKDATPFGTADSIRMERCRRTRFPNVPSDDDLSATGMDDMPREDWILKRALADELLAENAANLRAQAESSDLDDDIVDSIHLAKQKRHTRPPRRHYPMLKHLESQESAEGEHATYAHETDVLTELADSTYVVKLAEGSDREVPADIMDVDVVDSVRLEKTEREHTKGSKDHHVILRHLETQDSIVLEQAKHAHTDEFHRSTVETKMCSMTLSNDEDGNAAAASSPQVRRDSNKQRLMALLVLIALTAMDARLTHEDDGLWDELSHQQTREFHQHMAQRSRGSMALQALQNAATGLSSVASAAMAACRPPGAVTTEAPTSTGAPHNLSDFGIQDDLRLGDPLLPDYGYEPFSNQDSNSHHHRNSDFVFLEHFRLMPKREGYGAVANLDLFFSALYNYYYHRGLMPILCKGIVEVVSLVITLSLSVFLFVYLDWKELATCTNEASCKHTFGEYIIPSPLSKFSLWNSIVILYTALFTCYGVFAVWSLLHTIKDALESRAFFEDRLGISQTKLQGGAVDWDRDVVQKIVALQNSGEYRVAIHNGDLDGLVIAQRILRKENFLIALINRNMLDLTLPLIPGTFFSKSLEWSVYFCVLNYMFNHKYQIRPAFYLDPGSLKRRFMVCGIAHIIFMPFLLFFMTLHFSMQNLYDWKSTKQYMGPKEWSLHAKWVLREFNELPHFLERRLEPSYQATENYLKLFTQSELVTTIGRILALVGGSLGVVLLLFAAINDAILLHVKIGDWNLLWYVGVLGVMYSTGKAMLPDPKIHPRYTRNLFAEIDNCLAQVAVHTHYYPDIWKGRGWEQAVYKQVSAMFMYKAKLFVFEVASVMLAPVLLCVSLPRCAENICEFVMTAKAEVSGAGDVCGYATFDFDKFGDETWEGRTMGKVDLSGSVSASVHEMHDVEAAIRLHPTPKAFMGKMEKSFFSFKATHPSWMSTVSGQALVDRLEHYREVETAALAREQEHHMEAAAKQLETLLQMEQHTRAMDPAITIGLSRLNESYLRQRAAVSRSAGGADSGGGAPVRQSHSPMLPTTPVRPSPNETISRTPPPAHQLSTLEATARRRELTPLPFADSPDRDQAQISTMQASVRPLRSASPNPAGLSVMHYADFSLSTELERVLNRSTLDPDVSVTSSMLGRLGSIAPGPSYGHLASLLENQQVEQETTAAAERQYMLLQRYHAHVANQRLRGAQVGGQSFVAPNDGRSSGGADHIAHDNFASHSSTL